MNPTEKAWLRRARALAKSKPKSLRIYITDNDLIACKVGVNCRDYSESIPLDVYPGCVLTDLHDDMGYGSNAERSNPSQNQP